MLFNGEWNNCIIGKCDASPTFLKETELLGIKLNDTYYSAGKWMLKIKRDNDYPSIDARFKYEVNSGKESKFICALIQYDKDGNEIRGDYLSKSDTFVSISLVVSSIRVNSMNMVLSGRAFSIFSLHSTARTPPDSI